MTTLTRPFDKYEKNPETETTSIIDEYTITKEKHFIVEGYYKFNTK